MDPVAKELFDFVIAAVATFAVLRWRSAVIFGRKLLAQLNDAHENASRLTKKVAELTIDIDLQRSHIKHLERHIDEIRASPKTGPEWFSL